jgi:hypothetical protein
LAAHLHSQNHFLLIFGRRENRKLSRFSAYFSLGFLIYQSVFWVDLGP